MNAPARTFRFVPLPRWVDRASDEATLEAFIEAIEDEFTAGELQVFAKMPTNEDPVYRLLAKHYSGTVDLVDIARVWGLTRERTRQIEAEALAKVRASMGQWEGV